MNKLQLTKGELTKIILEEVRNLQEQESDFAKLAREKVKKAADDPEMALKLAAVLAEMEEYE
tara:strand:- start:214 stop:399 length:186 start_codon:yes stop_codon:yes gene_type:complete